MILYCPHTGPRLQYMAQWLGANLAGTKVRLTNEQNWPKEETVLNYSEEYIAGSYQVKPSGLLFETGLRPQNTVMTGSRALPFFFATDGDHPFDLLSAAFYLLSRYEEYLPHQKDMYGRFAHGNSLAFREGFLQRPLVDEWISDLIKRLGEAFPELSFSQPGFQFLPTYDVDMAWSYREKSGWRHTGGIVKQLLKGDVAAIRNRLLVRTGQKKDPFDVFEELDQLHKTFAVEPIYFFLLAARQQGYDKNIPPDNPAFQKLIKALSGKYNTGIHLSWQAWQAPGYMASEKAALEAFTGQTVKSNRMHYIKFDLPQTFRQLIELGIQSDYSMGYGSINGFRASTSRSCLWYDLDKEEATELRLFPFCYMEANSIFEQKDTPATALREMQGYASIIQEHGGIFISIFHNHLIGHDEAGRKWWQIYESFLKSL